MDQSRRKSDEIIALSYYPYLFVLSLSLSLSLYIYLFIVELTSSYLSTPLAGWSNTPLTLIHWPQEEQSDWSIILSPFPSHPLISCLTKTHINLPPLQLAFETNDWTWSIGHRRSRCGEIIILSLSVHLFFSINISFLLTQNLYSFLTHPDTQSEYQWKSIDWPKE